MTTTTKQNKGKLVNFRVSEELKKDFEITAKLRGASLSGLIHQLLVSAMREEKDREPKAFEVAEVSVAKPPTKSKTPRRVINVGEEKQNKRKAS